jgi:type IV fimbrial biogenesis protein FimT
MVGLAITGVLLSSTPSFVGMAKDNSRTSNVNNLLSAFNYAREASITRNTTVSVCQSADGDSCADTGWQDGWIVFVDEGVAGTVDGADAVVQVFQSLTEESSLESDDFPDFITYLPDGASNASGGFQLCDDRGAAHALAICVNPTGRVSVGHEDCDGGAIECPA